jgi:hypothetical protein
MTKKTCAIVGAGRPLQTSRARLNSRVRFFYRKPRDM